MSLRDMGHPAPGPRQAEEAAEKLVLAKIPLPQGLKP